MLQFLLDLRADVNRPDERGYTPLAASVWTRGVGLETRLFIEAQADVDAGMPLALSLELEDRKCAQLMLEAGAARATALAHRDAPDDTGD